jgi:hypothetical protein
MRLLFRMAVAVLILAFATTCGPPKTAETGPLQAPRDIKVEVNDSKLVVSWRPTGDRLISGYNIYISRQPLTDRYPGVNLPATIEPHNQTIFAGDTDPSDGIEHYEALGLHNGVPYYVSVRTVYPDLSLSLPSNEVEVVCGPRGEIELSVRYHGDHDGYSFGQAEYVTADGDANDLYFFSKDGTDFLASPSRLGGFLQQTLFCHVRSGGDLADAEATKAQMRQQPDEERIAITVNDWLWIETADGGQGLLKVLSFNGEGLDRRVSLYYAYMPLPEV